MIAQPHLAQHSPHQQAEVGIPPKDGEGAKSQTAEEERVELLEEQF